MSEADLNLQLFLNISHQQINLFHISRVWINSQLLCQ